MRRESLVASIVGELVTEVVTGRFREGMTLPAEPQLCERFEVSRTVVREAMVRLAHMGLVVIRQGHGTVVRARADWNELDPELLRIRAKLGLIGDLVEDLLAIRRLVEIEVAGNAALRRTDVDLAQLARLLDRLYATMDDPTAYTEADIAFHEALIAANGNELLRQMMRPVNQIRRIGSIITASRDPGILAASMAGHQSIYDAVTAGDAIGAREAMASHLGQFERDISEALTTAGPQHLDALATGATLVASR